LKINKIACSIVTLFCSFSLVTGCSNKIIDKSLKTKSYIVNESKVKKEQQSLESPLTGIYQGIDDMYSNSDYVVSGVVKGIEYFQVKQMLLRKVNVLVNESYKGNITKSTLISVLEDDGYLRLKSLYEDVKKAYEEAGGDKNKEIEDAYLKGATYMSDIKDIENDMLIKYYYINKEDSKTGDELLLFLTASTDDTYKDKKVKFFDGAQKLSYPKGAYAPLGIGMGKFTLNGDSYKRYNMYHTADGTVLNTGLGGIEKITGSYTVKEMEDRLKKLK